MNHMEQKIKFLNYMESNVFNQKKKKKKRKKEREIIN
jgi:hypothetical protein